LNGLTLIAVGVAAGELASIFVSRFIASQLWGVSSRDPLTFAGVVLVLVLVGLVASGVPARRATAVDPLIALRAE
jgi:ABC-type antimicrobial peptide transport system permease subunit